MIKRIKLIVFTLFALITCSNLLNTRVIAEENNSNEVIVEENNSNEVIAEENNSNEVINVPDVKLKAILNKNLNKKPNEDITTEEMKKFTALYAYSSEIEDLTGLEYAINLRELHMSHNKVSDLSPLAGLENLRTIDLVHNKVSDLSPLSNLKNLSKLHLSGNYITDLSPLSELTNLRSLLVNMNPVKDINPLKNLHYLTQLYINIVLHEDRLEDFDYTIINDLPNLIDLKAYIEITLKPIKVVKYSNLTVENIFKDLNDNILIPGVSNAGIYDNETNMITWSNVTQNTLQYFYNNQIGTSVIVEIPIEFDDFTDAGDEVENPHVKRVSYFREEDGQLYIDGYSYVKGIDIPNQTDIIQKLKFVDANSGKQVKTYELPNHYSTAASKDPNHGNNVYNYDWAKFKGNIDISSLPEGDYSIKIYTNAQGNKYDEIITFHSSITGFEMITSGKKFSFTREGNTLRLTVKNVSDTTTENPHVKRVSYFREEDGQLYIDGYSYVKGIDIPNQTDIIQKLKFVDANSGKQVKTYELPNYYSTAASKDPNHGNNVYNYDWAKFKGNIDVSDLPVGEYYIKIYTNAKKNAYDEIIAFHTSIGNFNMTRNGKTYTFERAKVKGVNTLKLTVK